MTNEEFQAHVLALRAAIERGDVECRFKCGGPWDRCSNVSAISEAFEYRIKPHPRELFVRVIDLNWLDKNPVVGQVAARYEISAFGMESASNLVKFREVIQ